MELKYKLIYWTTDHGVVKLPTRTRLQIHQKLHCHAVTLCSFYTTQETLSNSSVGYNLNTDISSSSMAAGAALSNDTQPQGMPWEGVNPLLFPGWKALKSAISRHQLEQALFLLGRSYRENRDSEKQISLCWRWPHLFCTPGKKQTSKTGSVHKNSPSTTLIKQGVAGDKRIGGRSYRKKIIGLDLQV